MVVRDQDTQIATAAAGRSTSDGPTRTGADYLRALAGRRVFSSGTPIEDVAEDPRTCAMAHLLAEMLDEALVPGPFVGSSGFPLAYSIASSSEDVRARGAAFAATARRSGGFMGRSPDFLATVLTAWRAASPHFGKHADNLVRYWERARTLNLVLTHAISDPPGDRHLPAELGAYPLILDTLIPAGAGGSEDLRHGT